MSGSPSHSESKSERARLQRDARLAREAREAREARLVEDGGEEDASLPVAIGQVDDEIVDERTELYQRAQRLLAEARSAWGDGSSDGWRADGPMRSASPVRSYCETRTTLSLPFPCIFPFAALASLRFRLSPSLKGRCA